MWAVFHIILALTNPSLPVSGGGNAANDLAGSKNYRVSFPISILAAAGAGGITGGFLSRGIKCFRWKQFELCVLFAL